MRTRLRYPASKLPWVSPHFPMSSLEDLQAAPRYFEQHPDEYPVPGDDNLVVGFGLGQLSASAVSCSKTLVDLIEPAVEAVRLAFHAGALVRRVSADPQPIGTSQERWSMKIAGTTEEVESQLQAFHEQQVCPLTFPSRVRSCATP